MIIIYNHDMMAYSTNHSGLQLSVYQLWFAWARYSLGTKFDSWWLLELTHAVNIYLFNLFVIYIAIHLTKNESQRRIIIIATMCTYFAAFCSGGVFLFFVWLPSLIYSCKVLEHLSLSALIRSNHLSRSVVLVCKHGLDATSHYPWLLHVFTYGEEGPEAIDSNKWIN